MFKKMAMKVAGVLGVAVMATATVTAPAQAAHYQGGQYGFCMQPTNLAYEAVWIEAYGVGSDNPKNYAIAGKARMADTSDCDRRGEVYSIKRMAIDWVSLQYNHTQHAKRGPLGNAGKWNFALQSGGIRVPCGVNARATFRYSVRYSNDAVLHGTLSSGVFRRC